MKKNYLILLTLLVALFSWSLIACEGGDDGDEKENSTGPGNSTQPGKKDYLDYIDLKRDGGIAKWEFGTSPATSLLYHIETVNGEHFVVEARKDANGVPTSLLSLIVQTKGENPEVSEILFDEQNRPVDVVAPNGVRILYEWLTDTKAAMTFIDPETDEQLNTVYDFALGEDQQTPKAPKAQMKREGEATLTVTPLSDRPAPVRAKAATGDRQGTIVLSSCGVGTPGQQCWVKVYDQGTYGHWATESSGYRGSYEAVWQSGGTYVYTLPSIENQPAIAEFLNIAGPKIKSLIDKMCLPNMAGGTYTDPMTAEMVFGVCLMVIKYTAITGPLAVKLGAACTALGSALLLYCNTLNKALYSQDPNAPSVQDLPLVRDMIDATFGKLWNNLVVKPATYGVPIDVWICQRGLDGVHMSYGYTTGSASSGPLPVVEIAINSEPQIKSFTLEPPAPVVNQGYDAIATLSCMPSGSVAVMTVVGTDGYSNTQSVTLENVVSYEMKLHVPGAYTEGVKDLCTVAVELPDGTLLKKQASLVFQ